MKVILFFILKMIMLLVLPFIVLIRGAVYFHSLHYKQSNGYVHAFDVRTKGHSEIRNNLLRTYFMLMGLNTLRHGGTGDHLHVSLKSHDRPGGI